MAAKMNIDADLDEGVVNTNTELKKKPAQSPEIDDDGATNDDNVEVVEANAQTEKGGDTQEIADDRGEIDEDDDERLADQDGERHRETAKERRARAKAAKERDKRELQFQHNLIRQQDQHVAELRSQVVQTQASLIDLRLSQLAAEAAQFEAIERAALTKQEAGDAIKARDLRAQALAKAQELEAQKKALIAGGQQVQQPTQTQPVPYARMAQIFVQRHPWYNPNQPSEDTAIVEALDKQIAREGYNPNTPDYWMELERRVAQRLPERSTTRPTASDSDAGDRREVQTQQTRKGPPVGGSKTPGARGTRIVLSAARVEALKEAGLWDDPATRARMAKKYAEYDRSQEG
jgi:hypothetical protein